MGRPWTPTALVGVVMASVGVLGLSAPAQASQSATRRHVTSVDRFQCGPNNWVGALVPERPWGGADFHPACLEHDACYSKASRVNRYNCDVAFRVNMYAACAAQGKGSTCRSVASTYFYAVRGFGYVFYRGGGANT